MDTAATTRYHYIEAINAGGYGEVWLAYDSVLGQTVALKRLHRWLESQPEMLAAIMREVQAGRQISSSNVVKIFDLVYINQHHCIVMEYVKGRSLGELFPQTPPTPKVLSNVILQMCAGLAAIHEAGFAHGDLVPHNVVIDGKGRVVIVDLGRATEISGDHSPSGPCPYTAPELYTSPSSKRSDMYAFGKVVLYLLGADPGQGQSKSFAVLPQLKPIVDKCVAKDPGQRYESAFELLTDLEAPLLRENRGRKITKQLVAWMVFLLALAITIAAVFHKARTSDKRPDTEIQVVVAPLADNSLSRLLADVVGVYLETEHLAVSRPQHIFHLTSLSAPSRFPVPPFTIGTTFVLAEGGPSASIQITRAGSKEHREFRIRSGHTVFDSLVLVAKELHLSPPRAGFDLITSDGPQLSRFAEKWQMLDPQALFYPQLQHESIPALLLKARLNARLFSRTGATENRDQAKAALTDLEKLGVIVSETVLLRASVAQKEGDRGTGVEVLTSGLRTLATASALHRSLGEQQLEAGFANEAVTSFQNALRLDPFVSENYIATASAYTALWQEDRAADLLEKASELDPSNGEVYSRLGVVYIRLGRFELARRALERNIELKPTASSTMHLGLANLLCGNNAQALSLLKGAVAEERSLTSVATLGAALRWIGDPRMSKEALEEARRLGDERSTNASELGTLAMVNAQLGNIKKADWLIARAARSSTSVETEMLYDSLVVDAFALRRGACKNKLAVLEKRHFPVAFAKHDPQIAAALGL